MKGKNILVRESTRFILCIEDDFSKVSLRDLANKDERLSSSECHQLIQNNFNEVVRLVRTIERKVEPEKTNYKKEKTFGHLRVIK